MPLSEVPECVRAMTAPAHLEPKKLKPRVPYTRQVRRGSTFGTSCERRQQQNKARGLYVPEFETSQVDDTIRLRVSAAPLKVRRLSSRRAQHLV